MSIRRATAWIVTGISIAIAAALWHHGQVLGDQLAAAQAEANRVKGLEARVAEGDRNLEEARSARKVAEARVIKAEERLAAIKPAPAPASAPSLKGVMAMSVQTFKDPAMRKLMKQNMGLQVQMMYGDLLTEWGLEGESRAAIADLLAEHLLSQSEAAILMMDGEISCEEVVRRQGEIMEKDERALADQLDAIRVARLKSYDQEMPDRMLGQQVDQRLSVLALDDVQREQVRAVLMEEARGGQALAQESGQAGGLLGAPPPGYRMTVEEVGKAREMLSGHGSGPMGDLVKFMKESTQRTLEKVKPLLSQDQFEAFQKQEAARNQMAEMTLKLMNGAGGDDH